MHSRTKLYPTIEMLSICNLRFCKKFLILNIIKILFILFLYYACIVMFIESLEVFFASFLTFVSGFTL